VSARGHRVPERRVERQHGLIRDRAHKLDCMRGVQGCRRTVRATVERRGRARPAASRPKDPVTFLSLVEKNRQSMIWTRRGLTSAALLA
jgi:hypothetical protein